MTHSRPRFDGDRQPIGQLAFDQRTRIAGRVKPGLWLEDASGRVRLSGDIASLKVNDIVALEGRTSGGGQGDLALHVESHQLLARPSQTGSPHPKALIAALGARARMNQTLRAFFAAEGFTEVETPNMVPSPGTDVHLAAFETRFSGMGPIPPHLHYLHTSPEFAMKRLLVSGMERVFQICKVYRDGEWTAMHHPEFTMVEWYRAFANYEAIIDDVETLVKRILDRPRLTWGDAQVDLSGPFERLTVQQAFEHHCGLDLLALDTADALRDAADARGLGPLSTEGAWDDLFHEIMLTHIEPHLGAARPTFLIDYPRALAVLSRAKDADPRVAERFELYIAGVELCNGFTELNDPIEQRARFEEDLAHRRTLGYPPYPMPEAFLHALEQGMPPSGGVALGLDRLLMLGLGETDIGGVLIR